MNIPALPKVRCILLAVFAIPGVYASDRASGQWQTVPVIGAEGTHMIIAKPTRVRLRLQMEAESRTSKGALDHLREHQASVRGELLESKAIAESIVFTTPNMTQGVPGVDNPEVAKRNLARQRSMQMLNPNGRGRPVADEEEIELPLLHKCKCTLFADWELNPKDLEQVVLLPSEIRGFVKEKDWQGQSLRVELKKDEKAAVDALTGGWESYSVDYTGSSEPPPVQIAYVAILSQDDMDQALIVATRNAKQRVEFAEKLLGPNSAGYFWGNRSIDDDLALRFPPAIFGRSESVEGMVRNKFEIVSLDPDKLEKKVTVQLGVSSSK